MNVDILDKPLPVVFNWSTKQFESYPMVPRKILCACLEAHTRNDDTTSGHNIFDNGMETPYVPEFDHSSVVLALDDNQMFDPSPAKTPKHINLMDDPRLAFELLVMRYLNVFDSFVSKNLLVDALDQQFVLRGSRVVFRVSGHAASCYRNIRSPNPGDPLK
jgi:hypothetical protein